MPDRGPRASHRPFSPSPSFPPQPPPPPHPHTPAFFFTACHHFTHFRCFPSLAPGELKLVSVPAAYIGVKGCPMCPSGCSRDASSSGWWPRGPRPLPHSPSPCCRSVLFQPGSHLANSLILLVAPSLGLGWGTPPLPFLSSLRKLPSSAVSGSG